MAKYTYGGTLVPFEVAKSGDLITEYQAIESVSATEEKRVNDAIKFPPSESTDVVITETPSQRINKVLGFGSAGALEVQSVIGDYKIAHADAAGTQYYKRDVVLDAAGKVFLNNIYICNVDHISTGGIDVDIASWDLLLDMSIVNTANAAAGVSLLDSGDNYNAANIEAAFTELASILSGEGASIIGLEDAAGGYNVANIEAALAKLVSVSAGEGSDIIGSEDSGNYFSSFHAITGITAATNAAITTSTKHRLKVGDTPTLSDTDSTPVLDGAQTVTAITSDFIFEVGVTTTGTGANGTVENDDSNYVEDCLQYLGKSSDGVISHSGNAALDMLESVNYSVMLINVTPTIINNKSGRKTSVVFKNVDTVNRTITFDAAWKLASGIANPSTLTPGQYMNFDIVITPEAVMIRDGDIN